MMTDYERALEAQRRARRPREQLYRRRDPKIRTLTWRCPGCDADTAVASRSCWSCGAPRPLREPGS